MEINQLREALEALSPKDISMWLKAISDHSVNNRAITDVLPHELQMREEAREALRTAIKHHDVQALVQKLAHMNILDEVTKLERDKERELKEIRRIRGTLQPKN